MYIRKVNYIKMLRRRLIDTELFYRNCLACFLLLISKSDISISHIYFVLNDLDKEHNGYKTI